MCHVEVGTWILQCYVEQDVEISTRRKKSIWQKSRAHVIVTDLTTHKYKLEATTDSLFRGFVSHLLSNYVDESDFRDLEGNYTLRE